MNKDNAKDYLPLVQALAEGKTIQIKQGLVWVDAVGPSFNYEPSYYRIKPEPPEFEVWVNENGDAMSTGMISGWRKTKVREVL